MWQEKLREKIERELNQDKLAKISSKKNTSKTSKTSVDTDPDTKLSNAFAAAKRRLPWPVQSGFISDRFGVKQHPVLSGVMINNNGIDIQTSTNATVRAVFGGEVKDISNIPGLGNVVLIQHGEYFTVYANLKQTFLTVGQKVLAKETIGTAGESGGVTEMNFQVWHNSEHLNPENWLVAR